MRTSYVQMDSVNGKSWIHCGLLPRAMPAVPACMGGTLTGGGGRVGFSCIADQAQRPC